MKIFKKKSKDKKEFLSKSDPGMMTGGNTFETKVATKLQEEIDLANLISKASSASSVNNKISQIAKRRINSLIYSNWVLLQFQANYFCGTCKFETEDMLVKQQILKVIRGAFLMGCAGMYKKGEYWIPVYISQITYSVDGSIKEASIYELDNALTFLNQSKDFNALEGLSTEKITGANTANLIPFQWGVMGLPAWITIWPFVNFQHQLLSMLVISSLNFNRKWAYSVYQAEFVEDEIEAFLDPTNPVIVTCGSPDELRNKFSKIEFSNNEGSDLLEYYDKVISAFYHLMGRRLNNDIKKERNVSNEVEASQENYDIVQSDWLNFFEIFINNFSKASGIQIKVIKEQENMENKEGDNNEDESNTESRENQ